MIVAFIGADPRTAELATMAVHLRWPDATPMVATTAAAGLEMIEREPPDVVLMHPDFTDMTLGKTIKEMRRFSNVPMLFMKHQGDEMELVLALELGADAYVRLPCDLTECGGSAFHRLVKLKGYSQAGSCPSTHPPTRFFWQTKG